MSHGKVTRYAVTHIGKHGLRTLSLRKPSLISATAEEAQKVLDTFNGPNGLERVLTKEQLATLEVRPCECWANSGDPCGIYFDDVELDRDQTAAERTANTQ